MGADMLTPRQRREVDALDAGRGGTHDIGATRGGLYWARRVGGGSEAVEALTPAALDAAIAAGLAAPGAGQVLTCLECGMTDPPPEMTCTTIGYDHRIGLAAGCPACLRLKAACAARPCPARLAGQVPGGAR
jgi:hypothetical protein